MCCLPADRCAGAAAHHIKLVQQIGRNMFLTLRELEESIGFWKAKKTSSILVFRGVLISYSYSIVMSRDFAYSSARTVGFRMLSKTCLTMRDPYGTSLSFYNFLVYHKFAY